MKKTLIALAAIAVGVSATAQEATSDSALALTLDVTYVNHYVFRGAQLADDSIQPSVEASYGDFYAGVWYSDDVNATAVSETDLYAGYSLAINETFSADFGITRYVYDGSSGGDTTEVFAGIKADALLSPSAYYYYDFDREVSTYIVSIGRSLPIAQIGLSVDLFASYGYVQIPGDGQDYSYWGFGAAVPYKLSETATLTTALSYSHADSSNLPAGAGSINNDQDNLVFSVGLSVGF